MDTAYEVAVETRQMLAVNWGQGTCRSYVDAGRDTQAQRGVDPRGPCIDVATTLNAGTSGWVRLRYEVTDAVCDVLGGPRELTTIWRWNDHPERTKAEVLALMDTVIERLAPDMGLDGPARIYTVEPAEAPVPPQEVPSEPETPAEAPQPEREPVPA